MEFLRGIDAKEAMDIGDKDAQYAGRIEAEAKRLGLVKSPPEKTGNLFPEDSLFKDIVQWVLPDDEKSGILFCRYTEFKAPEERARGAAEYHVLFINNKGNSEWDEHQADFDEAMTLFNRCLSWKDLASHI